MGESGFANPSVTHQVQTGSPMTLNKRATRCSSGVRMYKRGLPDSKISRMVRAARLSFGGGVMDFIANFHYRE